MKNTSKSHAIDYKALIKKEKLIYLILIMNEQSKYPPLRTLVIERKKQGLSRQDLAKASKVNEGTIKALECGINNPEQAKLNTLLALCDALHIKLKVLFPNNKNIG